MLRALFGMGPKVDLTQVLAQDATIVDVRTKSEYAEGHVKGSINIPLDSLTQNLHRIPKGKPVITCCRSGARSGMAVDVFKGQGFEAYNGGPWTSLNNLLKK
ncbi:MAG: rhodanese-like domain-containing protein [Flavobacteriales bacterium]|nr:rhodanese-like domain-containing protein [Flavobacteriales bacterium]